MYQAISYRKSDNTIHLWDDTTGYKKIKYRPYAYRKSRYGKYVALDGQQVEKVFEFERGEPGLYESDISPETRTLIDLYTDSDEISTGHRTLFFDIEVDTTDKFPTPETAENAVTSIAILDASKKQRVVWILDPDGTVENQIIDNKTVVSCATEHELLDKFLRKYVEIQPTIITGWNIDFFDVPYLFNRMSKLLGESRARLLSPIKDVIWMKHRNRYRISGVASLDYMALYKNFTYSQESSYSLEAISQKELGKGKVKYDGSLDDLMREDIMKFIDYNMTDVDLVYELDEKMKLIDLARGICHKGHVAYDDFIFATRYLDGAALTYLKRLNIVAPSRAARDSSEPLDLLGAYVKPPNPGRYKWVYDLDLTSLYPSIIMTLNISPETKVTKIDNFDGNSYVKGKGQHYTDGWNGWEDTAALKKYLDENDYSIAANGVIYDKKLNGFLPTILDNWFNERVEYKNLRKKYEKEGNKEQAEYFDRMQLVTKILLNSFYGVLGNPTFRFFDPDNAVAITSTGQQLIKFTADIGNKFYENELGVKKDYNIYIDTDSVFFSSLPLIEKRFETFDETDEKWMADRTIDIATEMQSFINNAYDIYAKRFHHVDKHRFDIKQEFVAKAGLWIAKKRYAQWLINQEGHTISRLDVKGLDVVRSSFPPAFRSFMAEVLEDILNDIEKNDLDAKILKFKDDIKGMTIDQIMFPTGIKNIRKYQISGADTFAPRPKGTPVHAKAGLNYNDMLRYHNVFNVREIVNGEKIRWTYLKNNPLRLDVMALKGMEDPEALYDYVAQYIDHDKIFRSAFQNKLDDFYGALNWGKIPDNNNLQKFFSFG